MTVPPGGREDCRSNRGAMVCPDVSPLRYCRALRRGALSPTLGQHRRHRPFGYFSRGFSDPRFSRGAVAALAAAIGGAILAAAFAAADLPCCLRSDVRECRRPLNRRTRSPSGCTLGNRPSAARRRTEGSLRPRMAAVSRVVMRRSLGCVDSSSAMCRLLMG